MMATADLKLHADTTELEGFHDFLAASIDLDAAYTDGQDVIEQKIARWRKALREVRGQLRIRAIDERVVFEVPITVKAEG